MTLASKVELVASVGSTRRPVVSAVLVALVTLVVAAACGGDLPAMALVVDNDPVPLPEDIAATLDSDFSLSGHRLEPPGTSAPPISGEKALEIAGRELLGILRGNNVPDQDPGAPDGLIRRRLFGPQDPARTIWVVAYRWKAGFDCRSGVGGPGPCRTYSIIFIDDQSGEVISTATHTS